MAPRVTEDVAYVGKIDWELRRFHGEEYSTHHGSSYNSYLVRGRDKTVLVDTVWAPFAEEFLAKLAAVLPLSELDAVIVNHAEPDHSGAMPALMAARPDLPIYCTPNAVKSLAGHYHAGWTMNPVRTGDRLDLGGMELIFIEAPMLHWPDTMFSYLTGREILFSNDGFGQHLAAEQPFDDLVDPCVLLAEAMKYYANILTPFSAQVTRKIQEFTALGLPLAMICPSHGVIWRKDPLSIVGKYLEWAAGYRENRIAVLYDTMWNGTRRMAEAIAEGLGQADPDVAVSLNNIARSDKNDLITEVFRSKAVVLGSPTINRGILFSVAGILEEMRGLAFKGKKAAAFGAYGWSGESVKMLSARLAEAGFEVVHEGLRLVWHPDDHGLEACRAFGRDLAARFA